MVVMNRSMSMTLNIADDGVTDVTAKFQQAIDFQLPGGMLFVPPPLVNYKISAPLNITKPLTIFGENSLIRQSAAGQGCFNISSSGVRLYWLNLQGPQFANQTSTEKAVSIIGPSAGAPLTDINVSDCTIWNWGMYGIYGRYVDGFRFGRNKIANVNYGGIGGESIMNGEINRNKISNIIGQPNAYGIIVSRDVTSPGELDVNPFSSNITIDYNEITNVPFWEGIDTHAGRGIIIKGNRLKGCWDGIAVVNCKNALGQFVYGPKDCVVEGNVINSGKTDGSANYGFVLSGASAGVGSPTDLAEACTVTGNTIRGYGQSENNNGCAVYLLSTKGLVFSGNTLIEPGKIGIMLDYNNYGFSALGNTIQDVWSQAQTVICVSCRNNWNRGVIGGGSHVRGSKVAPHVNDQGLYISSNPNNWINYVPDYSEATLPLYDPGAKKH